MTNILIGNIILVVTFQLVSLMVHTTFLKYIGISLSIMNLYCFICGAMLIVQLTTAMTGIRRKYEAVNNFLILNPNLKIQDIKILSKIHLMTTESIEMFNTIYGPAQMFYISVGFSWFSMFIFKLFMSSSIIWSKFFYVSIYSIMINIIYFSTVILMFYHGEGAKKEGRRTIKLLYGMQDALECENLERKMQKLISQICDTKVEFSCGLVDFNWKFFFKVSYFGRLYDWFLVFLDVSVRIWYEHGF